MANEIISQNEEDQIDCLRWKVEYKKFCKTIFLPVLLFASIMEMSTKPVEPNFFTLFPSLSPDNVLLEGAIAMGAIFMLHEIHKGNQAQRELDRLQSPAIPVID